ncbi:MAG: LysE family transporter [Hyphomicrobiaceae bacterium]
METNIELILAGLGVGILIAAPVGPVNVLCIQRTLEHGFWGGLAAGIGALIGDGLIALVATFGLTAISDLILENRTSIKLIGGLLLILFGTKLYRTTARNNGDGAASDDGGHHWVIPQTFFLTVTNPGAVLGLFAILGSVTSAVGGITTFAEAGLLVLAVMGGSLLWWMTLARIIATIRHKLTLERLTTINRAAGLILIVFALVLIGETLIARWG